MRGTFKRLVDRRIGMVITRLKYSKILQNFSTTMTKGVGKITREKGRDTIIVK